jgi:hypothetical protein
MGSFRDDMNHVFVDFENVPTVDLALIGTAVAKVTLLIGEKQRRLDLALVRQIHAHADKVALVEVGASGRNALDLVLAWHLGQTAERHPNDAYFIVSKDKDFDPLIAHLRNRSLEIQRVDTFSALPFLGGGVLRPKLPVRPRVKATKASVTAAKKTEPITNMVEPRIPADDRLARIIECLRHTPKARPVRKKTLLSYINSLHANHLSPTELDKLLRELQQREVIALDSRDRVTYFPAVNGATSN